MTTFKTSRRFNASPAAVFAAFEDPARLARWWGPDGFRNTFDVFEFKPGGLWRFTMHGPNGADYANESSFLSVVPGREVVIQHASEPHFVLTVRLEGQDSGTLVSWHQAFEKDAVAASVRHIVEPANEQNLSRWQAEVAASEGNRG